jgi:hypothetical protein
MNPNLIIFRVPDEEGQPHFVQLDYDNGSLAENGKIFTVHPGDSYLEMGFGHVVLAEKTEGGSHDITRFIITEPDDVTPAVIHSLDYPVLLHFVQIMVNDLMNERRTQDVNTIAGIVLMKS